ncbi:MAG: HAD family phosphatase [Bryobacterales bacterium]|nr:HAD family phosphatase [Bryobacterales bacterium]
MIQTVIFDLGGVIVPLDFPRLYGKLASHCDVPAEEIPRRIAETGWVGQLESGQMPAGEFTGRIVELLGLRAPESDFRDLWSSLFPGHTLLPESLMEGVKKHHRLLLLSNTNAIHFGMVRENYPLLRHFDHFVLSHEVGAMKPSPVIYRAAIEAAGCRAEDCFFTDDVPAYVEGARKAGIRSERFESYEQITALFDEIGVGWR